MASMTIPRIDPSVRYRGSSFLRELSVENLRQLEGAVVIQDSEALPLVVIVPYETYLAMQPSSFIADADLYLEKQKEMHKASGDRRRKPSKKDRVVQERAASDVVAQEVGREDIDYSDTESSPTVNVANLRGTTGAMSAATKKTTSDWRANRKPLLKPKEQK